MATKVQLCCCDGSGRGVATVGGRPIITHGGGPPPSKTGACCTSGACSVASEAHCESGGGVYQGDDTTCDSNCCAHYGTCCHCKPCPGFGDCDFIDYPGECDMNVLDADCGCTAPSGGCTCGHARDCDWAFSLGTHPCFSGIGRLCGCFGNSIDECPPSFGGGNIFNDPFFNNN